MRRQGTVGTVWEQELLGIGGTEERWESRRNAGVNPADEDIPVKGILPMNTPTCPQPGQAGPWRRGRALVAGAIIAGCGGDGAAGPGPDPGPGPILSAICATSDPVLFDGGVGRGGIPSLLNPPLVPRDHPAASYVDEYAAFAATDAGSVEARVVALVVEGTPIGIPHNILWWHEIVNLDVGGRRLVVTYCPLTGSSLVFDITGTALDRLGVSGLIFENNLVMFDEGTESLWPQLCLSALGGPLVGDELTQVHAVDMRWEAWKERFPGGLIVSDETGFGREYRRFPYPFYEARRFLLFPLSQELDTRRGIKERVFGIGDGPGGIAFPFSELASTSGERLVVITKVNGEEIIVLWNGRAGGAGAYYPRTTDGHRVTLRAGDRGFRDEETGSLWGLEGNALEGPFAGSTLALVPEAFVAYWFAWAAFHPRTTIWTSE